MSERTFRFFSNTAGLNLRQNEVQLDEREAEEVLNLHQTTRGGWTTANIGYKTVNPAAPLAGGTYPITGMTRYTTVSGLSYLVSACGGQWFTVLPATGVSASIGSGLSQGSTFTSFVTFQGMLIGCNGVDAPQKWSGSGSVQPLAGWPPTIAGFSPGKPSLATISANRLVFSGDSQNPSVVYLSALENPENFTPGIGADAAGAILVSPGDGQRITALATLYLPVESTEILVIFKERSTFILTGNDADTFQLQKVSDEFGAVSGQSVVRVGNDLLFLSEEGVTSLTTSTVQGNIVSSFLSERIIPQIRMLNRGGWAGSFALHHRERQEVWWVVPDGSSIRNQRVLVYHYGVSGGSWSRRSGIEASCGLMYQGECYTGTYNGRIQCQMSGSTYDGAAIPWTYRTPFYDFGSPRTRKRVREVVVHLKQIANLDLKLSCGWDIRRGSVTRDQRTLSVIPDASSSVFHTAIFGQDRYGTAGVSMLRFIPNGSGRFFQMEFSANGSFRPVELEGWTITAIYGGER
jgi:hypothetical protein